MRRCSRFSRRNKKRRHRNCGRKCSSGGRSGGSSAAGPRHENKEKEERRKKEERRILPSYFYFLPYQSADGIDDVIGGDAIALKQLLRPAAPRNIADGKPSHGPPLRRHRFRDSV